MKEAVDYGTTRLEFSLTRSLRKTLAIEVHPDLSIHVIAPMESSIGSIRGKVLKRGRWILQQQQYFEQFLPRTPEREYVSGETHLYLGRKYLLKIREARINEVKLKGSELQVFTMNANDRSSVKKNLADWYYNHAKIRFENCLRESLEKFRKYDFPTPPLIIKRMEKRWGSCTSQGTLILNPEIIKAPSRCIEYVIIHELCHLVHPNHSKEFYSLQQEMMPDWEKWKERLEKNIVL